MVKFALQKCNLFYYKISFLLITFVPQVSLQKPRMRSIANLKTILHETD